MHVSVVFPYNVLLHEQIVQINFYKLVSKLTFPTCQQHECDDLAVNLISNMWTFSTSTAIIIWYCMPVCDDIW